MRVQNSTREHTSVHLPAALLGTAKVNRLFSPGAFATCGPWTTDLGSQPDIADPGPAASEPAGKFLVSGVQLGVTMSIFARGMY